MTIEWILKLALSLCLAPCVLATTVTLFTKTLAWYISHHTAHGQRKPKEIEPISALNFIKALSTEVLHANFWIYYNLYFRLYGKTHSLNTEYNTTPIILVHGFFDTPYAWAWFREKLSSEIKHPVYTCYLSPPWSSVETLSHKLELFINELNAKEVILVGQSLGGVVSSYYTEHLAKKNSVKKVITIGSPLHGTYHASLFPILNIKQLSYKSDFLKELREKILEPSPTEYFHMASRLDNIVIPWDSGLVEAKNTENMHVLDNAGHATLLYSKDVLHKTKEWLSKPSKALKCEKWLPNEKASLPANPQQLETNRVVVKI